MKTTGPVPLINIEDQFLLSRPKSLTPQPLNLIASIIGITYAILRLLLPCLKTIFLHTYELQQNLDPLTFRGLRSDTLLLVAEEWGFPPCSHAELYCIENSMWEQIFPFPTLPHCPFPIIAHYFYQFLLYIPTATNAKICNETIN